MDKIKNYIITNHLKLIIILFLLFIVNQQKAILKEAESCQCWSMLDDIQDDVRDIKSKISRLY
jgi:hypothetical protein